MDYIILLIGLISASLGIVGNTWDKSKRGIKKLLPMGWIVAFVIILTYVFSTFQVYKKNKQLWGIKKLAEGQIRRGISKLLSPLNYNINIDSANFFIRVKDTLYLHNLFEKPILQLLYNGKDGNNLEHPFREDSTNIQQGENLLNDVLIKYNSYLDNETIKKINAILLDKYFNSKYKFTEDHFFIEIALYHFNNKNNPDWVSPPYATYRPYYKTTDMNGNHTYDGIISFIDKIETLYTQIEK